MSGATRRPDWELVPEEPAVLRLRGDWRLGDELPAPESLLAGRPQPKGALRIDGTGLGRWDSSLVILLLRLFAYCHEQKITVDSDGLPDGLQRLLRLARAVPVARDRRRPQRRGALLVRIGEVTIELHRTWRDGLAFLGESVLCCGNLLRGRPRFRRQDLFELLEDCGAQSLPIVTLISTLVGMILAFVGAVQLRVFGADIFVADLVGLGMAREMAAMMTAIIMAGRTGAAFAAQLGTMQVNDEIDALRTMGIPPMDFLVAPRLLALTLMLPLLSIYSMFMGILGGGLVSAGMLDIGLTPFFLRIQENVGLEHFLIGGIKAVIFGYIVAFSGCLRGMQCGRSAQAVGQATTSAVVTAIVLIVVADAVITILCQVLGV
ncbi:ABC transporter permease [Geothermobacter ehrlichii]|uniref:ABC transporter permease n=1 Tax=Geothermobacter ehrlichii TaxID=213224 RepID=UPI0011E62A77|nr:MlaE family lipid ABC transporter permease subunit [Geothermobacter ehrlichii]